MSTVELRHECVEIEGAGAGARLLYASDLHLRFRDLDRAEQIAGLHELTLTQAEPVHVESRAQSLRNARGKMLARGELIE